MKAALLPCLLLLLAGCNQSGNPAIPLAPLHTWAFALRPGQHLDIQNGANIRDFRVHASFPVNIDEASCEWRYVTSAHFVCNNSADIVITDQRPLIDLLGQPNSVTVTFRAWLAPISEDSDD